MLTDYIDFYYEPVHPQWFQKYVDNILGSYVNNVSETHLENLHYEIPKINVRKKKLDNGTVKYKINVLIPGYEKDDINVEVIDGNTLSIQGKKDFNKEDKMNDELIEFKNIKSFHRKLMIPNIQEKTVIAKFKDGILQIELISGKRINKEKIEIQ